MEANSVIKYLQDTDGGGTAIVSAAAFNTTVTSSTVLTHKVRGVTLAVEITDADSSASPLIQPYGLLSKGGTRYKIPIVTTTDTTGQSTYMQFSALLAAGSDNWAVTIDCLGFPYFEVDISGGSTAADVATIYAMRFN